MHIIRKKNFFFNEQVGFIEILVLSIHFTLHKFILVPTSMYVQLAHRIGSLVKCVSFEHNYILLYHIEGGVMLLVVCMKRLLYQHHPTSCNVRKMGFTTSAKQLNQLMTRRRLNRIEELAWHGWSMTIPSHP